MSEFKTGTYSFSAENMIAQGNTAEVFDIGDEKILKLFREGIARSAIEREYDNSRIAALKLTEVPAVYDLLEHDGRMGIVFRKVSGDDMMRLMLTHPTNLKGYVRSFSAYHAKINTPVADDMRTVAEKLRDEIGWENDLTEVEKKQVLEYLSALPDGDCLCHGDFHPGNVMVSGNDVFFLDWMTACKGDPCADAARTYLLLRYGEPMHVPRIQLMLIKASMRRSSRIYLREYCRITGVQKKQILRWVLPVAAARLNEWLTDNEREKLIRLIRHKLT